MISVGFSEAVYISDCACRQTKGKRRLLKKRRKVEKLRKVRWAIRGVGDVASRRKAKKVKEE